MKYFKKLAPIWIPFSDTRIGIYASSASYYLLLSALPAGVLILYVTPHLSVAFPVWQMLTEQLLPVAVQELIAQLFEQISHKTPAYLLSISTLTALWSASKGVLAMTDGLEAVVGAQRTKGFFLRRLKAIVSLLLLGTALLVLSITAVLGGMITKEALSGQSLLLSLYRCKTLLCWLFAAVIFYLIYRYLPGEKMSIKACVVSASIVSAAWITFTGGFSLYIRFISETENMYGGFGLLLLSAIWLKLCMHIVLCGGKLCKLLSDGTYHPICIIKNSWKR